MGTELYIFYIVGAGDSSTERSTPPTSQLVSKLFPKLRQEKPKPKPEPVAEQRLAAAGQAKLAEGVQSKLLRDKLAELEQEIERFRTENSNLGKLRKEREEVRIWIFFFSRGSIKLTSSRATYSRIYLWILLVNC